MVCNAGTVGPVCSVRYSGSRHPTIYRKSPSALVCGFQRTLGLSLTCPVAHSSPKSEILVLLTCGLPRESAHVGPSPVLGIYLVAMVSGVICTSWCDSNVPD